MTCASDIPEGGGFTQSRGMARALVRYLDDPKQIQRAIREEFARAPTERSIVKMRQEFLERKERLTIRFDASDGYDRNRIEKQAERENAAFLSMLRASHPERFPEDVA